MGGSALLAIMFSMLLIFLHHRLQFLAGMKSHHSSRGNGYFFTGLRIATGALRFIPQLEIAKTRKLDTIAILQRDANLLVEGFHHVFGFALVKADFFE